MIYMKVALRDDAPWHFFGEFPLQRGGVHLSERGLKHTPVLIDNNFE